MSTVFSQARARTAGAPAPRLIPRPRLTVVRDLPFRPPRMPFVVFFVALLAGGLIGLLLLNTELQRGTFEVTELSRQSGDLRNQQQALEQQVRELESPQHLADRALRLGMVPNPNPVFLRMSDGRVLGVPTAGKAGSADTVFGPELSTPVRPSPVPTARPSSVPSARPSSVPSARPSPAPSARPATGTPSTGPGNRTAETRTTAATTGG